MAGQYHWVSEFSPRKYQKFLSYVVGEWRVATKKLLRQG